MVKNTIDTIRKLLTFFWKIVLYFCSLKKENTGCITFLLNKLVNFVSECVTNNHNNLLIYQNFKIINDYALC